MPSPKYSKLTDCDATDNSPRLDRLPKELVESARIEEDRRVNNRGSSDRRRDDRIDVDGSASLRALHGSHNEGRVDNLSEYGCRLRLPHVSFDVGDVVWFRVDTIQPWQGTVRWVSGDSVGVEFDRPFYPAVFDLIVQMNKPVACSKAA